VRFKQLVGECVAELSGGSPAQWALVIREASADLLTERSRAVTALGGIKISADVFVLDGQEQRVVPSAAAIHILDDQVNLTLFCDDHADVPLLGGANSPANQALLRKALERISKAIGDEVDTEVTFPSVLGRPTPTGLTTWGIDSPRSLELIRSAAA